MLNGFGLVDASTIAPAREASTISPETTVR
jgi:hypothetical protein